MRKHLVMARGAKDTSVIATRWVREPEMKSWCHLRFHLVLPGCGVSRMRHPKRVPSAPTRYLPVFGDERNQSRMAMRMRTGRTAIMMVIATAVTSAAFMVPLGGTAFAAGTVNI